MKQTVTLLFFFYLLKLSGLSAQDLASHQWQNRILLLLTEDKTNTTFQNQLDTFRAESNGMEERKLLVYQLTPTAYFLGLDHEKHWKTSNLYSTFKSSESPFEIVLIGLDGGVKLHQPELLSPEKLFAIIDGMPMRRAELRKEKN